MNTPTTLCPFCSFEVKYLDLTIHFPHCYVEYCERQGVVPLCTCARCGATTPNSASPIEDPLAPVLSSDSTRKRKAGDQLAPPASERAAALSPNRVIGKACLLCGTKRSPQSSGIPLIHVGQHRTVILCKKAHLLNEEEQNKVIRELERVKASIEKADTPVNAIANGSGDEAEEEEEEEALQCAGLLDLVGKKKCTNATDGIFFISSPAKQFCRASHLVRYLVAYNCGQGISAKGRGKGKA